MYYIISHNEAIDKSNHIILQTRKESDYFIVSYRFYQKL